MHLSIVIPAYNEEKRIALNLKKILNFMRTKDYSYEIVVVDDGSKDNTINEVSKIKSKYVKVLTYSCNKGKGYAVKYGMMKAKGNYVLFSDSDLSTSINQLDNLMNYITEYPVVIASRNLKKSIIPVKQPWYRIIAGKAFPILVRIIMCLNVKDTQCGFKLFRKDVVNSIFSKQVIDRWAFDVEIIYIAKKLGLRIKEVPVIWVNDPNSKVNLVKDSVRMFLELLRIRINSLKGIYK